MAVNNSRLGAQRWGAQTDLNVSTPIADLVWREVTGRREPAPGSDVESTVAFPPVSPRGTTRRDLPGALGVDTASWQGQPDWHVVAKSGRCFVMIKASEGASTSYASLDGQYRGARAAGLAVGLYHYAKPNLSPERNADSLAAQVNRLGAVKGHLPPCLDLEEGRGDLSGWAKAFIMRLRQRTGCRRVLVYSSAAFFTEHIGEHWMDPDIALWIAHYGREPGNPRYRTPRVAIHQYSCTGRVPGIKGDVDLNYALWPLTRLLTDGWEDDLTPEEHQMLADIHAKLPIIDWFYGQFAGLGPDGGPAPFPQVPGWPTLPGGTDENLSLLDYGRRNNVEVREVLRQLKNLSERLDQLPAGGGEPLSDEDVQRVATAVLNQLVQRVAGP